MYLKLYACAGSDFLDSGVLADKVAMYKSFMTIGKIYL